MKSYFKSGIIKKCDGKWGKHNIEGFLQLPGMKDRDNRPLYGGSIVQDEKGRFGIVDYEFETVCYVLRFKPQQIAGYYGWADYNLRVVGHITDHPDFLLSEDSYLDFLIKLKEREGQLI